MDPDLLNLDKEVNLADTIKLLLTLNPDDMKKFYYLIAGMKVGEHIEAKK